MPSALRRLALAFKAASQLGPRQTFWYAYYQLGLRAGFWQKMTPAQTNQPLPLAIHSPFPMPHRQTLAAVLGEHRNELLVEADEITAGQIRMFGGPPVPLLLSPPGPLKHWSVSESIRSSDEPTDIKYLWEPARFGWAYTLGRAFLLTGNETYPAVFWRYFEDFLIANPPNLGPNWSSGQEVALRLIALLFAARVFNHSSESTPARMNLLAGAVAAHASRIPPTLSYARAQHNNHLISEALGLAFAGLALPDHPRAAAWKELGWKTLLEALTSQIAPDGTYAQHSMNYHRLMLQATLLGSLTGGRYPQTVQQRLAAATRWLLAQLDPPSGNVPNYGNNDGANILPLAAGDFCDYRPTAQAAARAFLGHPALPPGPWDEMSLWLGLPTTAAPPLSPLPESPAIHRLGDARSWAVLRAVQYTSRPAHADQLHVDLWWQGENVALDAGTYRYTAASPWDNSLAHTRVHNTVEVNHHSQMQRAGRFLWLDWAQAKRINTAANSETIAAEHDGYRALGILHRRILARISPENWRIEDQLLPYFGRQPDHRSIAPYTFRLHWLLPDYPYALTGATLRLSSPNGGTISLTLTQSASGETQQPHTTAQISLVRAGQVIFGAAESEPTLGWYSPTYGVKIPALSFSLTVRSPLPTSFLSEWTFQAQ